MAPLEPWEKVLVDPVAFGQDVHNMVSCIECHGGVSSSEKEIAHEGIVANPSSDPEGVCGVCHDDIAPFAKNSMHTTLEGYWASLEPRGASADHPAVQEMFGNHCSSCHATCGECHVSQPAGVGGGLIKGHVFQETPSLTRNCTACHGSRVGKEYLGQNEGILADVHFRQARMNCVGCHTGEEMHGMAVSYEGVSPEDTHRYGVEQMPTCESCHEEVLNDTIDMHQQHIGELSCQVCHSVAYTSCDGCHVQISEKTGNPFFTTEAHYLGFYIGKNPLKSDIRPYDYVPVRHAPIDQESFSYYGEDLLPTFDALPTWRYATPHNIQLQTPQNSSCGACHGSAEFFLTADKVKPEELLANQSVIIDVLPVDVLQLLRK